MEYFHEIQPEGEISLERAGELIDAMLEALGPLRRVLLLPPDSTRPGSWGGELTMILWERLHRCPHVVVMPALGTHMPMTGHEIDRMYPGLPRRCYRTHNWFTDAVRIGEVPGSFIKQLSEGRLDYMIPCEINRLLIEEDWDRIISIGQLVPHEVAGIANHNKNIYIGLGGRDVINKTHYLGAVCDMERAMGRAETPVRAVLDYMDREFGHDLPITYLLTVRSPRPGGGLATRGLFAGDDKPCFRRGAELCRRVNIELLDRPLEKVVVYLDRSAYKSTWLGNKAIYRTRMAMADGGELIVIAPGVSRFGEDDMIDRLIRRHGYRGRDAVMAAVDGDPELADNLSAAAHLIHGSSEGRFRITYCPGGLSRREIEAVGFEWADPAAMAERYPARGLIDGYNQLPGGEEIYWISNPSTGLWGLKSQFE